MSDRCLGDHQGFVVFTKIHSPHPSLSHSICPLFDIQYSFTRQTKQLHLPYPTGQLRDMALKVYSRRMAEL
jgi:hypothetical protein